MHSPGKALQLAVRLGLDGVTSAEPLKPGLGGTELWRLHRSAGDLVLRTFADGTDPVNAEREVAAHQLARRGGVPTPAVRACDVIDGRPVIAMDWVDGPLLTEQLWRGGQPVELGRRCGALLGRLHTIADPPAAIMGRHWIDWSGDRSAELAPLLEQLPVDTVLHLDFHPENLIISGNDLVVIDWANVRVGPAAADLARTLSILELIIEAHPRMTDAARDRVQGFRSGLLDGYAEARGGMTIPRPVTAWAYAVQLHDLAGSWVPNTYFDRLRHAYAAALASG